MRRIKNIVTPKDINSKDKVDRRSYVHNLSSCEIKPWKNFKPEQDWTHYPCDMGAVLYQLSYQANWELVALLVRNIP